MKYNITEKKGGATFQKESENELEMKVKVFDDFFEFSVEEDKEVKKYHLFAHMDINFVKVGDKVEKYKTKIGTIGKGNTNNYWAHLHFSISKDLSVDELYNYVIGWSKEKIEKHYIDPTNLIDFDKMFGRSVDVGNRGYGWLDPIKAKVKSYHPGVDINGHGGGDTDFGWEFTSSCDGKVIYEKRTDYANGGWGNLIIIEED